jgi:hypothetical protein
MTVRQTGLQSFNVPREIVAQRTTLVLRLNPAYKNLREIAEGRVFKVKVKPNILLLGTDMTVVLDGNDSSTTVTTTATSQALIMGDVGGFYYRYVRDFLSALVNDLRAVQGMQVESSKPTYKVETAGFGLALIVILVIFSIWVGLQLDILLLPAIALLMLFVHVVRSFHSGQFLS